MPDEAQKRTDPRIPLDRERLQAELQTNSRLITVHWNELRHKMDIDCFSNWQEESREHWHDDKFLAKLLSESLRPYYTGASVANIEMLLEIIAKSSPVIPPLSEIILPNKSDEREWGGEHDYIADLFPLMHIDPTDTLSQTLIRKWFWQGASLLQNKQGAAFGADGMLVLQGAAGVGKTSFFRYAAMKAEWFVEGGRLSEYDKDFQRRCLTSWITEFGELERSVTSQTANTFKALVTNAFDAYRLTYDRQDTEAPRRTNFGATCNSTEFIPDDGVSRRCWTVPVKQPMQLDALSKFPWEMVWKQAYAYTQKDMQGFRLTADERRQLNERNRNFAVQLPAEQECRDILDRLTDADREAFYTTATDFKTAYPAELGRYSAKQVSAALQVCGMVSVLKRIDGAYRRWLLFPTK
jgi:hypothetical protein